MAKSRVLLDVTDTEINIGRNKTVWMCFPARTKSIFDLKKLIIERFNLSKKNFKLILNGGVLLEDEDIGIFQKGDIIKLQYEETENNSFEDQTAKSSKSFKNTLKEQSTDGTWSYKDESEESTSDDSEFNVLYKYNPKISSNKSTKKQKKTDQRNKPKIINLKKNPYVITHTSTDTLFPMKGTKFVHKPNMSSAVSRLLKKVSTNAASTSTSQLIQPAHDMKSMFVQPQSLYLQPSCSYDDTRFSSKVNQVLQLFPHMPYNLILKDLLVTRSVELTIENILAERLTAPDVTLTPNAEGITASLIDEYEGNPFLPQENPYLLPSSPDAGTSLDNQVNDIIEMFPHLPYNLVLDDLIETNSMELTIENILAERLVAPEGSNIADELNSYSFTSMSDSEAIFLENKLYEIVEGSIHNPLLSSVSSTSGSKFPCVKSIKLNSGLPKAPEDKEQLLDDHEEGSSHKPLLSSVSSTSGNELKLLKQIKSLSAIMQKNVDYLFGKPVSVTTDLFTAEAEESETMSTMDYDEKELFLYSSEKEQKTNPEKNSTLNAEDLSTGEQENDTSKNPFHEIMKEVVFTISGFTNPLRSEIRDYALEMGATYKDNWDSSCTHLICAFVNTPKYIEVKEENGNIVTEDWIIDCHEKRTLLPWKKYRLEWDLRNNSESPESEKEEIDSDVTKTKVNGTCTILKSVPNNHKYKQSIFQPAKPSAFLKTVQKEMKILKSSLPEGIMVKSFEDRLDLYSALIKGPKGTPYEDGLFFFDIQFPANYPNAPPRFHYVSFCPARINPNLYETGKVCVSLLGTWSGKGSELWNPKTSNLFQVLVSIQGLILVSEPYYNEPGFETSRNTPLGIESSRLYNEMVVLNVVQAMSKLVTSPPEVFQEEVLEHFKTNSSKMIERLEAWVAISETECTAQPPSSSSANSFLKQYLGYHHVPAYLKWGTTHPLPSASSSPLIKQFISTGFPSHHTSKAYSASSISSNVAKKQNDSGFPSHHTSKANSASSISTNVDKKQNDSGFPSHHASKAYSISASLIPLNVAKKQNDSGFPSHHPSKAYSAPSTSSNEAKKQNDSATGFSDNVHKPEFSLFPASKVFCISLKKAVARFKSLLSSSQENQS